MRKLKKWSCLLLALLMLPALAACGKKQQPDSDASQNEVQDTDTPQDSTPTEEQTRCWWCISPPPAAPRLWRDTSPRHWEPIPLS
ncbi:MAG: hypothetical protein V8S77_10095 [Oscillospiraceae bacterium]